MADYKELIQATIDKEKEILGESAIDRAKNVENLAIDAEGNIEEINGEGKKVLRDLVDKYTDVGGNVSATLIARELEKLETENLELPNIIEKRV